MIRTTFILSMFFLSATAAANSQIIFSKDGSKATITLLAFTTNPDANLLYQTLSQPPITRSGKDTKHFEFKTDDGADSIEVSCVFSKLSEGTGSCVVVLQAGPHLQQDPAHNRVQYSLEGSEADRLAKEFIMPASGISIYHSGDNLLNIGAVRNPDGTVNSFLLTYGN